MSVCSIHNHSLECSHHCPTLQIRQLRHREAELLACSHTVDPLVVVEPDLNSAIWLQGPHSSLKALVLKLHSMLSV